MDTSKLGKLACQKILPYREVYREQNVIVCDTETVRGKPESIQFYDGLKTELIYVNESTIYDVYCDYVAARIKPQTSVWFFYAQFDLPIIHYPFKDYFTYDGHTQVYGEFEFNYVTGKTWFGNHTYKRQQWVERDAFQYVFTGLEKVAKDLAFTEMKKERPSWLGERKCKTEQEKKIFEEYAIQDVIVLWELVHWILNIHRQYDVGLSVSLADLCGKIFRKKFVDSPILATSQEVTFPALKSYHGGKTEMYVKGPMIVKDVYEYDIVSAYPYAMSQIGNFMDYEIISHNEKMPIVGDAIYRVSGSIASCHYHALYTSKFERKQTLAGDWVTGYELLSAIEHKCFTGKIEQGYVMISHNEKNNPLANYVWHFFKKKQEATETKNRSERTVAKLSLNALYGKFISRIAMEDVGDEERWKGGVIFHPLIATLITGFVRAYVHRIEHVCQSLHTSTDAFITKHNDLSKHFPGYEGLGSVLKEYQGDVLLVRPKVYVIFDKLRVSCHHKFDINEKDVVYCLYCGATVLKAATHGFFGSIQMLLNMWKGEQTNYIVKRMVRLKEAKRSRDMDMLPFVFSNQRRSINVDWSQLTWRD